MSLKKYHVKRNFEKTPEPSGVKKKTNKVKHKIYLIQEHAAHKLHYDLRLEMEGVLKSWAVPKGPSLDPNVKRLAVHVEDHPLSYANFEGIIPQGEYGGGAVLLWDKGSWEVEGNVKKAYSKGHLIFTLHGEKLKGKWSLIKLKNDEKNWLLIKINDSFSAVGKKGEVTQIKNKSIVSGLTLNDFSRKLAKNSKENFTLFDESVQPELPTLMRDPPNGEEWLHEVKLDGYRFLCFIKKGKVTLHTRGQLDWTNRFPQIVAALEKVGLKNAILDGEIVALDQNNKINFQLLQNQLHEKLDKKLSYYIFDVLNIEGDDLTELPLEERKKMLKRVLRNVSWPIAYHDHVLGEGHKIFKQACKLGYEGIVSKKRNSHYTFSRSKDWVKCKCLNRQEFIICGYIKSQAKNREFASLILGSYEHDKIKYRGLVGTGFTEKSMKEIYSKLKSIETNFSPFTTKIPQQKIQWVKPQMIAEVTFSMLTDEGILRHASFMGLREDEFIKQVKYEKKVEILQNVIGLTHPDKLLYLNPPLTKLDLAYYYQCVAKLMLPYVKNRPLAILRCPNGQGTKCFYQKHIDKLLPGLQEIVISEKHKQGKYIYISKVEGLISLVQLGALEIHQWGCLKNSIEKPDLLVFDLDPSPEVKWHEVISAAFIVKDELSELNLQAFLKTTGGKGLHLVVPIEKRYEWPEVEQYCHTFAMYLSEKYPQKFIANMSKKKRVGKIFVDYLRNQKGATMVSPYSTRNNPNANVSVPIFWDELEKLRSPNFYNVKNLIARLDDLPEDPWMKLLATKQRLKF